MRLMKFGGSEEVGLSLPWSKSKFISDYDLAAAAYGSHEDPQGSHRERRAASIKLIKDLDGSNRDRLKQIWAAMFYGQPFIVSRENPSFPGHSIVASYLKSAEDPTRLGLSYWTYKLYDGSMTSGGRESVKI